MSSVVATRDLIPAYRGILDPHASWVARRDLAVPLPNPILILVRGAGHTDSPHSTPPPGPLPPQHPTRAFHPLVRPPLSRAHAPANFCLYRPI